MAITLENRRQKPEAGFALLIAVIFMSVMLAFGLSLGALSYKQQILSSYAAQSQYAFYAADAALECALFADQYQDLFAYPATLPTSVPAMTCDGSAPFYAVTLSYDTSQIVVLNRVSLDLNKRCADVTVYKPSGGGTTYIFSQGYNVSCDTALLQDGAHFVARGINTHYDSSAPTPPPPPSTECTGGTITHSGGYTIHRFISSGTLTCTDSKSVEYLVVAGGGGAGGSTSSGGGSGGGGGGAGGMLTGSATIAAQSYSIVVGNGGGGGASGPTNSGLDGAYGGNSSFNSVVATGGGSGGGSYPNTGGSGGSGGGGSYAMGGNGIAGQGNNGAVSNFWPGGGGGGAGGVGTWVNSVNANPGGPGLASSISGTSVYYAGGGAGGGDSGAGVAGSLGGGGSGGGGGAAGGNGSANTGGGGGGGGWLNAQPGGTGGSGIVIIRYLTP